MELQRATKPSLFKHSAVSRNGLGSWTTCLLHSEKFPFPTGMEKHNGNFTKRLPCATLLTNDKSMLYSTPKKNAPVGHRWGHFLFFEASFAWNGARSKTWQSNGFVLLYAYKSQEAIHIATPKTLSINTGDFLLLWAILSSISRSRGCLQTE